MVKLVSVIGGLLAVLLAVAVPVLVIVVFWKASTNTAALVTLVVGLVGAAVAASGIVRERRREHDRARRAELGPIYEEFFALLYASLDEQAKPEEVVAGMTAFTQKIIFWGSEEVIRAVLAWRRLAVADELTPANSLPVFGDLLVALRHDLGHKDDLTRADLLSLFINDYDEQALLAATK